MSLITFISDLAFLLSGAGEPGRGSHSHYCLFHNFKRPLRLSANRSPPRCTVRLHVHQRPCHRKSARSVCCWECAGFAVQTRSADEKPRLEAFPSLVAPRVQRTRLRTRTVARHWRSLGRRSWSATEPTIGSEVQSRDPLAARPSGPTALFLYCARRRSGRVGMAEGTALRHHLGRSGAASSDRSA
jgi:hypothetical protein